MDIYGTYRNDKFLELVEHMSKYMDEDLVEASKMKIDKMTDEEAMEIYEYLNNKLKVDLRKKKLDKLNG